MLKFYNFGQCIYISSTKYVCYYVKMLTVVNTTKMLLQCKTRMLIVTVLFSEFEFNRVEQYFLNLNIRQNDSLKLRKLIRYFKNDWIIV